MRGIDRGSFSNVCFKQHGLVIAAVVICGALACEYSSFDDFASKYGKSYTDDEVDVRRTNWEMAKAEIAAHNARVSSWTAGLNEFADMSWEEFQQRQLMAPQDCSATHTSTGWVPPKGASIPSSIVMIGYRSHRPAIPDRVIRGDQHRVQHKPADHFPGKSLDRDRAHGRLLQLDLAPEFPEQAEDKRSSFIPVLRDGWPDANPL